MTNASTDFVVRATKRKLEVYQEKKYKEEKSEKKEKEKEDALLSEQGLLFRARRA